MSGSAAGYRRPPLASLFIAAASLLFVAHCGGRRGPAPAPTPATTSFPNTNPDWLRGLASDYPYAHELGNVRVFSDISARFSADHAQHLKLVWDFFNSLYARNRGG
jgi:hypothetical protein